MTAISTVVTVFATLVTFALDGPATKPSAGSVHVVGVYEAGADHLNLIDPHGRNADWPRICAQLAESAKKAAPSPAKRLWDLLPEEARAVAEDAELVERIGDAVSERGARDRLHDRDAMLADHHARVALHKLTSATEAVLVDPRFASPEHFTGVALDDEAARLLKRAGVGELSPLERQLLGRRLFEATFAGAVQPSGASLGKLTVPVRVAVKDGPVTLVLCAYESVRWSVTTDPGAKVERVIVSGYSPQVVTGTDAPVEYHVRASRQKGEPTQRYFYAYKPDDENYPKLVEAVKALTGKDVTTFQGRYSDKDGRGFVVDGVARPQEVSLDEEGVDTIHTTVGMMLSEVLPAKEGSTWDVPPEIITADAAAQPPVEFVALEPIEVENFWVRGRPLLFTQPGSDIGKALERMKNPEKAKATGKKFVLCQFEMVRGGRATIKMTRRDALGNSEGTSELMLVVGG